TKMKPPSAIQPITGHPDDVRLRSPCAIHPKIRPARLLQTQSASHNKPLPRRDCPACASLQHRLIREETCMTAPHEPAPAPIQFVKACDFFVGIDSDGCAFDTMEVKHKECFIPNIIKSYKLAAISKFVREVAEFVNLYSVHRGINRFPGLVLTIDLL